MIKEAQEKQPFFSRETQEILEDLYGDDTERVLDSIGQPSSRYYIRVNTLRSPVEEVRRRLLDNGVQVKRHPLIKEALYTNVGGPLNIPSYPKLVRVDKFTAEAVMQGAHVYAPGVIYFRGVKFGDKVSIFDEKGTKVASGVAQMGEPQILNYRRGLAVAVTHPKFHVPSLRETTEFQEGLIYLQSLPAILTSIVLDPQPGETIVDFNCSPGGKLSHICQITKNNARILGIDRTKRKIQQTKETLSRLGCRGVSLIIQDSRYLDIDIPRIKADKCIIDPPCSSLGVLPKTYVNLNRSKIESLADYQRQFLKAAFNVLKPGGIIVYSVCTMTREECEGVIEFAVHKCGFEIAPQKLFLASPVKGIKGGHMLQKFHPHIHGSGYFIAKLKKKI